MPCSSIRQLNCHPISLDIGIAIDIAIAFAFALSVEFAFHSRSSHSLEHSAFFSLLFYACVLASDDDNTYYR